MQVEQAIFTSLRSRKSQGYHLVAQSSGLDDQLARRLCTWGPSHASLMNDHPDAESLNFHPLTDDWFAVSRTVYGGPEYSGRGGLQVFTQFLLLRREQLARYENHPLLVVQTAQLLGNLRLVSNILHHLPPVELPERPLAHFLDGNSVRGQLRKQFRASPSLRERGRDHGTLKSNPRPKRLLNETYALRNRVRAPLAAFPLL